ncbi:MAG TPA: DNA repair protein RecO, partial [Acidimicrobiales bacterium]|nr:DNA repair protein RecO [Acidimicrobiales bacterium]
MGTYREEGLVLRTWRLGEADRILSIATPGQGKVRAVAKGVRKTKSHIGARLEPLSHVSLLCWRGRELDVVNQVEVLDHFRAVREDLDRMAAAMTMLEITDHLSLERHAAPELFRLVVGALRTLEATPSPLVLTAFCWKLLGLEGVGPVVERCARCASPGPLVAFEASEGGLLCPSCRRGQAVSPEAVALLQRILGGELGRALREIDMGRVHPEADHLGAHDNAAVPLGLRGRDAVGELDDEDRSRHGNGKNCDRFAPRMACCRLDRGRGR